MLPERLLRFDPSASDPVLHVTSLPGSSAATEVRYLVGVQLRGHVPGHFLASSHEQRDGE